MGKTQFLSADDAVALIGDESVVGLAGGGGGLVEASLLHEAVERRFLKTGQSSESAVRPLHVVDSLPPDPRRRLQGRQQTHPQ